ncbi:MAG TPA: 2-dehydropantoate 2-reductase, partial [Blastocatellia bacterium]
MRFIIHGAGSIGSLIGGRLAESGAESVLIARDAHADEINRSGLLIQSREGDRVVKGLGAVTHPRYIKPKDGDVIILTVKSSQTAASVQSLRETFPEETPIVCMQNGVRNEEIAAGRFRRVFGGMLGISATFLEPGKIAHTRGDTLSIGNYPLGCDDIGFQIAARFEKAGFRTTTHESIMAVKWSKLILNLNNATFAIIDKHLQLGMVTPTISNFMAEVQEEGLRALGAAGISLEDADNPIDLKRQLVELRSVIEDREKIRAEADSPMEFRTYPSTWMDLKLKRGETEAGYFNGE